MFESQHLTRDHWANTHLQGTEPTPAESRAVLAKMKTIVDLTEKQLNYMLTAKPQLEKLHVGGRFSSLPEPFYRLKEKDRHLN